MHMYLYLSGELVPVTYDYDMDLDGVLTPSKRPMMRNRGICLVVLQRGSRVPTFGQQRTIDTIRTINPNWTLQFYFQWRDRA